MELLAVPTAAKVRPMNWLIYVLITVVCWGVYGIFLHNGTLAIGDPVNGRIKAFLIVGLAYFLVAVLAPIAILMVKGGSVAFWDYPAKGFRWSLLAGTVGAIGALGVLLAFGAKGTPAVVMSLVFAGAPIVNALVAIALHPPAGGWGSIKPQFYLGILLAAAGAALVSYYKPNPVTAKPGPAAAPTAGATHPSIRG
jgi:drug/metabolite transporter (DMT)-like permease